MDKVRILVIDDSEEYLMLFRRAASRFGQISNVEACADGKQALEYFQNGFTLRAESGFEMPDLVLIDVNMPLMDGFEFIEALGDWAAKQSHDLLKKPPVFLMVSSSSDPKDIKRSKAIPHVSGYHAKRYDPKGCMEMIEECLKHHSS